MALKVSMTARSMSTTSKPPRGIWGSAIRSTL